MSNLAKFKINLNAGEIEIEGSESFVENQIKAIESLMSLINKNVSHKDVEVISSSAGTTTQIISYENPIPSTFGEWLHAFRKDILDEEKALITARYVQSRSPENDFKTSEVNKALKEHGIKLSNPSTSLKRLVDKKLMFQTRKIGSLKYLRISEDGQEHLETLKRN